MDDNEIRQSGNIVVGDQAGRDVHKPNYVFQRSDIAISYMSELLRRFAEEQQNNLKLNGLIDDLDYYNSPLTGDVLGLEQKLTHGNRESFIDYALRAKERFHKKLVKYQFFESAQKINVHLLALVQSYFEYHIAPKIHSAASAEEISTLVQELVINPLLGQLEENTLGFTALDINGMLYFLTGNCHIKWT